MPQPFSHSFARAPAASSLLQLPPRFRRLMLTLLSLWALAGNTLTLPLFFGFDLLFGSIAAFLAMYWLGMRAGLLVAAIGGSATWLLWGHPYAMLIIVAEVACVGWLRQRAQRRYRRRPAFAAADTLFWLALGIPLILLFYHLALDMEWVVAWLVALKQALNGIINAAIAGLIVLVAALIWGQHRMITFDRILFNILVLALLAPVLLLSLWQNKDLVHDLQPSEAHLIERGEHVTMLEHLGERLREQPQSPEDEPWSSFSLESPTTPLIDDLQGYFLRLLLTLLGLALFGVALAAWLSTWLTRPLRQLIESTQHLPAAIAGSRPMPRLTKTPIRETDELAETILGMAHSLRISFEQVEQEKQRQSRQQALATLQARLLSVLVEQQGDEDSFGVSLCREVEGILPHHRCLLLRQAMDGTFTPFRHSRKRSADFSATRLAEHPAIIAGCREALNTAKACPLAVTDIVSTASSGLVLPIVGYATLLVAIEQRPSTVERTETGVAFARAILETATSTAGVAFEALQLRRRHQVLTDALSQAQTGVMITERIDGDDLMTYVNSGFEAMTGYSATEVIGHNCRFLQGEDRAQEARWQMREALQAGEHCSVIMRNYRKDGSLFWNSLSLSPMRDREGQVTHYIGVQQDVTELQEARERQRVAEQELADYAAQLEHMIDVLNLSQPYAEQIESLLRLAGCTLRLDVTALWQIDDERAEHLLLAVPDHGPDVRQAVPSTLVAEAIAELGCPVLVPMGAPADGLVASAGEQAVMIGLALESLTPNRHPERLLLTLEGTTTLDQLDLGQSQLLRLIVQRIAAVRYRQHLQETLVQVRERETIGHLASGVSHDFNNLLGVIDANLFFIASALHEHNIADPEVDQVIAETLSALGQAKVLTSGMLTMSGSGKIPLEPLDVADAIGELSSIIEQVLPARIRLEIDLAPGLQALSNRAFLQSALLNLSLNARDAIDGEGTLTIAARPLRWQATTPLVVGELAAGDCVEIRVSDTGGGIPPKLVDKIFKPLFTTKAKSRGHGFGLFMVREFVSRTQAGLSVDSVPGAGSCFRLLLPAEVPG